MEATHQYVPLPSDTRAEPSVSLVFSFSAGVLAVALREKQHLIVGREEPAHVVIDDRSLSRLHARFWLHEGQVQVEDCGSTNGTVLEGVSITSGTLAAHQVARLGAVEVRVAGGSSGAESRDRTRAQDFSSLVDRELERARFFARPCALVAVEASSGSGAAPALARILRAVDLLEHYGPRLSLLLLPEAGELEVRSLADALQRMEPGVYRLGAALFPGAGSSAETLIAASVSAARTASSQQLRFAVGDESSEPTTGKPIVHAASMRRVHALISSAARTTIPVLITGETGSGKESLASAVHERSARAKRPFKTVNSAALPSTLISSTLFGHERGAFTGADRQSPGLFEQAHGGTLFLDEVGELSLEAQAALLRALETKRIVRVGGAREIEVDVRLVAATHRDLGALVAAGRFREDLLYRLDAFTVRVPPLRERVDEILPLAQHFLAQSRVRWGSSATSFSPAVQSALQSYTWPGNVRQLRNVVERAAAVCSASSVELDDLPDALFVSAESLIVSTPPKAPELDSAPMSLPDRLRRIERDIIRETLERTCGNQSEAARLLGLPRRTLAHKVHGHGLLGRDEG